jgi:hypothetical protein
MTNLLQAVIIHHFMAFLILFFRIYTMAKRKFRAKEAVQILMADDSDAEDVLLDDYPESDLESESDEDQDKPAEAAVAAPAPQCQSDDHEADDNEIPTPRPAKRRRVDPDPLSQGWGPNFTPVSIDFRGPTPGPTALCSHLSADSTTLELVEIFLTDFFWEELCNQTNRRAQQVKEAKPNSYYARNFKEVSIPEMKAFIALRLLMENSTVKPRFEDYWKKNNFVTATKGFRDVMERDRFLALWTFLHFWH